MTPETNLKENLYSLEVILSESGQNKLFLNQQQLEAFGYPLGQEIALQIGFDSLSVEITEQSISFSPNTFYLSCQAFSNLTHYHGESLYLVFSSKDKLILGPTIGITISTYTLKNLNTTYALEKRALLALKKGVLLYFFHLHGIDFEKNLIHGYYFDPIRYKWLSKLFSFPKVIYQRSRYPFHKYIHNKGNNPYTRLWQNPEIQWINSTYGFSKWKIYQALDSSVETKNLQPETAFLTPASLENFLNNYKFCFVKNSFGRCGQKVLRIERAGDALICKTGGSKLKLWKFTTLEKLYAFIMRKLGPESIIQQGISLARINDRPFDIRVLVQKNITGDWVISALSFRIADPQAVVTNIAAGAEEVTVAPDHNYIYPSLCLDQLEKFSQKVLTAIENYYGRLGEVGLDIGLDQEGKIWLIEANDQPSSRGYKEAASESVCNQIFGLPLDYAKYLAEKLEED